MRARSCATVGDCRWLPGENMRMSPLLGRLERMKQEVDRGKESFERKLRYFLWVN